MVRKRATRPTDVNPHTESNRTNYPYQALDNYSAGRTDSNSETVSAISGYPLLDERRASRICCLNRGPLNGPFSVLSPSPLSRTQASQLPIRI